jgi:hypothetical protein
LAYRFELRRAQRWPWLGRSLSSPEPTLSHCAPPGRVLPQTCHRGFSAWVTVEGAGNEAAGGLVRLDRGRRLPRAAFVRTFAPPQLVDVGKPRYLIECAGMYLDELPSVRVTGLRRSGALTPNMTRVAVTLQGGDGTPVSSEVGVVRVRMRSGVIFVQFLCGSCGRRARILRLHAGHITCGRCTGLRYWCEGKPAVRRAQRRIEHLKATRFHGGPVSRRPGRTMERRAQLTASLRRSEAVVRRHRAGCILVALGVEIG